MTNETFNEPNDRPPESNQTDSHQNSRTPKKEPFFKTGLFSFLLIALGVILPVITLGVELVSHMCRSVYIDPIPNIGRILLVSFVPLANFFCWRALCRQSANHRIYAVLAGMSIAVSLGYTLVFVPILPFMILAVWFVGLGLLGLAPLLSMIMSVCLSIGFRKYPIANKEIRSAKLVWLGVLLGALAMVAPDVPTFITDAGLRKAQSDNPQEVRAAVRLLRVFGDRNCLLMRCYGSKPGIADLPWLVLNNRSYEPISETTAREVYYRVTGTPFNSVKRPAEAGYDDWFRDWDRDFDRDVAGTEVGGKASGVTLSDSQLKGHVTPDAGSSYMEWTLDFKNNSDRQQEARTQISLPPGGSVSRVTLWINGQPCEAVFGEKGVVRAAYTAVVARKRDPLLVTSAGPGKVLIQCFPIPPKTRNQPGEMKILIGITSPLELADVHHAMVSLPRLTETNFVTDTKHQITLTSDKTLSTAVDRLNHATNASGVLIGKIDDIQLQKGITINLQRNGISQFWVPAPLSQGHSFIVSELQNTIRKAPKNLYVVIDGGKNMGSYRSEVAQALTKIPSSINTRVLFASDEISGLTAEQSQHSGSVLDSAIKELKNAPFLGGPENASALKDAWLQCAKQPDCSILWIHGPQPVSFKQHQEFLDPLSERQAGPTTLYDFEVEVGANKICEKLPTWINVEQVPRHGTVSADLGQLLSSLDGQHKLLKVSYNTTSQQPSSPGSFDASTAGQLASLWAAEETRRLLAGADQIGAVKLATRYRVVTPVTGAVVLETKKQYKEHGLDPDNPENNKTSTSSNLQFGFGSAPEPEEWCLMFVAACILLWHVRRRQLSVIRVRN